MTFTQEFQIGKVGQRRKVLGGSGTGVSQEAGQYNDASQAREYCAARSASLRAARPGPSAGKRRPFQNDIAFGSIAHPLRFSFIKEEGDGTRESSVFSWVAMMKSTGRIGTIRGEIVGAEAKCIGHSARKRGAPEDDKADFADIVLHDSKDDFAQQKPASGSQGFAGEQKALA